MKCEECGGRLIKGDRGYWICKNCGLEQEPIFKDVMPLDEDGKIYGYGIPIPKGLVSFRRTVMFRPSEADDISKFYRLQKMNNWDEKSYIERTNLEIVRIMKTVISLLRMTPDFLDKCCFVLKKVRNCLPQFKGRSNEDVACCIVYLSALLHDIPLELDDLLNIRIMQYEKNNKRTIQYFMNQVMKHEWFKKRLIL